MDSELKTAEELATLIRVETSTVHRLARQGRIPCIRVTRKTIRFILDDVLAAVGVPLKPQPEAAGREGS
jgi:excisionase family DNA binding protein